jgi:ribosome maturation factor RimP
LFVAGATSAGAPPERQDAVASAPRSGRRGRREDGRDVTKGSGGTARRTADIEAMIGPLAAAEGCELWGLELLPSGRHTTLRVYIDREQGVSVDDCEAVSRRISALFDVEEPIAGQYTLEVSSPGMDRILFRLEHYAERVGETVEIRLTQPFEGRRKLTGVLAGVEGDEIVVQVDEDEYLLPLEWIQRARIVPRFD